MCCETYCTTRPYFNYPGCHKGLYCKRHALPGMINVIDPVCQFSGCTVRPYYNWPGTRHGMYCQQHAEPQMVDVKSRTCQFPGCNIRPYFNYPGTRRGIYCQPHAEPQMINVMDRKCLYPLESTMTCQTKSRYGWPGQFPTRCAQHKELGQIVDPRKRCESNCKNTATWGLVRPQRCEQHKGPMDRDFVLQRCVSCLEPSLIHQDQLCEYCSGKSTQVRLAKQLEVKHCLEQVKLPVTFRYDRILPDHCGMERPDFIWDCGTHYVIVEVDEYQHQHHEPQCEHTRMVNITQALHLPCIWIRYNPDSFHTKGKRKPKWLRSQRHQVLIETIQWAFKAEPSVCQDLMRIIYLFYDNFCGTIPWNKTQIMAHLKYTPVDTYTPVI